MAKIFRCIDEQLHYNNTLKYDAIFHLKSSSVLLVYHTDQRGNEIKKGDSITYIFLPESLAGHHFDSGAGVLVKYKLFK